MAILEISPIKAIYCACLRRPRYTTYLNQLVGSMVLKVAIFFLTTPWATADQLLNRHLGRDFLYESSGIGLEYLGE